MRRHYCDADTNSHYRVYVMLGLSEGVFYQCTRLQSMNKSYQFSTFLRLNPNNNCFIFSELIEGSVSTNLLVDGSTVTLLPRAETGLIVSRLRLQTRLVTQTT